MEIPSSIKRNAMEHIRPLGEKLGYSKDKMDDFELFLDSISTIMEKADPMEWDKVGVKLENGKVILPRNFEAVLKELVTENEMYAWFIPEKYGGYGYSNLFVQAVMEILSYVDISFSIMAGIGLTVMEPLIYNPQGYYEPIIENFARGKNLGFVGFSEPQAGSNLQNVKSESVQDGNEFILNGTKIWISNGGYANTGLILTANIVDGKQDGHNVFVVENEKGVVCERLEEKSGLHVSPTAQLHFEDVRVPKDALVARQGNGYRGVLERLMSMRIAVSMQATGAAQRSYHLAKEYAENRVQFDSPIIKFPGVSRKLEEMEHQIPRMRKYAYLASFTLDKFVRGWIPVDMGKLGPSSEAQAAEMLPGIAMRGLAHYHASSSKTYNAEVVQHIAYDATQIYGGNGFVSENEVNKILRDVRVLPIYEGTSEIHEWIISRSMQAVEMVPQLKPLAASYEEETVYEQMLFTRFPKLRGKI